MKALSRISAMYKGGFHNDRMKTKHMEVIEFALIEWKGAAKQRVVKYAFMNAVRRQSFLSLCFILIFFDFISIYGRGTSEALVILFGNQVIRL